MATANMKLPLIAEGQGQPHVTHNAALDLIDALFPRVVASATLASPPPLASRPDPSAYIVPAGGAGYGTATPGGIAVWIGGAWVALAPKAGWRWYVADVGAFRQFNGTAWVAEGGGAAVLPDDASFDTLGVGGAEADDFNRLAVYGQAALFNSGAGFEVTINKAAAGHDAAFAFKTAWAVRALFGLLGSDDFALKVSPDGSAFNTALTVARATGRVTLPEPVNLTPQASAPASPINGMVWAESDGLPRARVLGRSRALGGFETPQPAPTAGQYFKTTCGTGQTTGTIAGVASRLDVFPFSTPHDLTVDQVAINCTTLLAGALARVVLYEADGNGWPTNKIYESADLDLSATGIKTAAAALTLRAGVTYWAGVWHSSTATISAWPVAATPDLPGAVTTQHQKVIRAAPAWGGTAPAVWSGKTPTANVAAPAIWLRSA